MKVNEVAGLGNHYTALNWEYDTRVGRRWNQDPVVKPWESSYATFSNNPIQFADPIGNTASDPKEHKVQKGETLSGIAKKAGMKTKDLAKLNGITNMDKIKAGQVLKVNPEVDFSSDPYTSSYYNNKNNAQGTNVKLETPVDIAVDFMAGTGPENTLVTDGAAIDQIKNLPSVQALFKEGWATLNADGKLTPGEVFVGSYNIGKLYQKNGLRIVAQSLLDLAPLSGKSPGENSFIQSENVLGSYSFSMRVNSSGNLTICVSDNKTIRSLTDGIAKGFNVNRSPDMVIIPGFPPMNVGNWGTTTYQRYVWDVFIYTLPTKNK